MKLRFLKTIGLAGTTANNANTIKVTRCRISLAVVKVAYTILGRRIDIVNSQLGKQLSKEDKAKPNVFVHEELKLRLINCVSVVWVETTMQNAKQHYTFFWTSFLERLK